MLHALKCLIPTLILFCILDLIWLGHIGKPLYLKHIGQMLLLDGQTITPRPLATVLVYFIFAIMIWFIVLPLANYKILHSFYYGALVGFVVYGIYDTTNLAVFKDWTTTIALVDWLWGTILCSMTSGFCAYLHQWFK